MKIYLNQFFFLFYFHFKETLIVSPIKETMPLSDKEIQDLFDKFPGFGEEKN
jgi:hypothetical protein